MTFLLENVSLSKKDIKNLKESLDNLNKERKLEVKRIGLVKFNPFGDTGGSLSFSLSLLNDNGNGVVITSLHGRGATRVYCKDVESGKESGIELSLEERKAVTNALKK